MIVEQQTQVKTVNIREAAAREFFSQELVNHAARGEVDGITVDLDILSITTSTGVWRYRFDSRMCSQTVICDFVDYKAVP